MKILFLSILMMLCITSLVLADETGGKASFGIKGGATTYAGDIGETNLSTYYDFDLNYWFSDYIALGLKYGKGFLHAAEMQAENDTREGRAKNRRIEFFRIK